MCDVTHVLRRQGYRRSKRRLGLEDTTILILLGESAVFHERDQIITKYAVRLLRIVVLDQPSALQANSGLFGCNGESPDELLRLGQKYDPFAKTLRSRVEPQTALELFLGQRRILLDDARVHAQHVQVGMHVATHQDWTREVGRVERSTIDDERAPFRLKYTAKPLVSVTPAWIQSVLERFECADDYVSRDEGFGV